MVIKREVNTYLHVACFVGKLFRRLTSMRYTPLLVTYLGSGRYEVEVT